MATSKQLPDLPLNNLFSLYDFIYIYLVCSFRTPLAKHKKNNLYIQDKRNYAQKRISALQEGV